jgi:hypothetical protein
MAYINREDEGYMYLENNNNNLHGVRTQKTAIGIYTFTENFVHLSV